MDNDGVDSPYNQRERRIDAQREQQRRQQQRSGSNDVAPHQQREASRRPEVYDTVRGIQRTTQRRSQWSIEDVQQDIIDRTPPDARVAITELLRGQQREMIRRTPLPAVHQPQPNASSLMGLLNTRNGESLPGVVPPGVEANMQEQEDVENEEQGRRNRMPRSPSFQHVQPRMGLWDVRTGRLIRLVPSVPARFEGAGPGLTDGVHPGSIPPPSARTTSSLPSSYRPDESRAHSMQLTMTSSTTSNATPSKHPFERRLEDVKLSKTDLNSVVMDYLISEGYPSAAQKFATEANIQPTSGVNSIQERVEIREAIYSGDIQSAIERINELNPLLLERDHSLHFALLRLQLVELIRNCIILPVDDPKTLTAMKFAETELAPRASTNPQFLDDLERTMTLLFYEPKNLPAQYAVLLEPKLRKDVAQRVNEALLKEQGERTKAKLYDLVRLRAWSEMKAREAKKDIPEHLSLGLEGIQNGQGKEPMPSNGEGEAMVA